jgi:hypothetical protein
LAATRARFRPRQRFTVAPCLEARQALGRIWRAARSSTSGRRRAFCIGAESTVAGASSFRVTLKNSLSAPLGSLFAFSRKPLFGHAFLARLASIGARAHPARMFGGRPRPLPVQRRPVPRPGHVRSCPGAGSRYGRRRAGGSRRLAGLGEDAQGRERERDSEANRGDPVDHCCGLRAIRCAAPVALAFHDLCCPGARWGTRRLEERRGLEGPAEETPEMSPYP